jgi:hypothetical protein
VLATLTSIAELASCKDHLRSYPIRLPNRLTGKFWESHRPQSVDGSYPAYGVESQASLLCIFVRLISWIAF